MKLDREEAERQADAVIALAKARARKGLAPSADLSSRVPFRGALRVAVLTGLGTLGLTQLNTVRGATAWMAAGIALACALAFEALLKARTMRRELASLRARLDHLERVKPGL